MPEVGFLCKTTPGERSRVRARHNAGICLRSWYARTNPSVPTLERVSVRLRTRSLRQYRGRSSEKEFRGQRLRVSGRAIGRESGSRDGDAVGFATGNLVTTRGFPQESRKAAFRRGLVGGPQMNRTTNLSLMVSDDSQLIQDAACEIVGALSCSCGGRGEHHCQGESIALSRRRH